jgi:hypothetical protein
MLDFLWHLRGSVSLDGDGPDELAFDRVQRLLELERKSVSERGSEHLVFRSPFWGESFEPKSPAMGFYNRGRFWIERDISGRRLCYDLCGLHSMVFALLASFPAFFFGLADHSLTEGGLSGGLKYAAGAFAWLYGMNIVLALRRAPTAIRKAVATV